MSDAVIRKIEQLLREDSVLAKDEEIQADKLNAVQSKRRENAKWVEFLKGLMQEGVEAASPIHERGSALLSELLGMRDMHTPRFRVKGNNTAVGKVMYETSDWIKPSEAGLLSGVSTDDTRKVMDRLVVAKRAMKDTEEMRGYKLTELGRRDWETSPCNEKTAGQDMPAVDPLS